MTGANAIANNAYSNSADKLRIQLSAIGTNYLLADFRLTSATFASAPTTGVIQLAKVPRDFSGNAGPTPSASMLATQIYTMGPAPSTGNASTSWVMSVDSVPLDADADYWVFNNATGVSLNSGWVLTYVPWSPGT
ncbi:hypothetical protein BZM27_06160 [Paraburkholderia steynii]|uniref:Uncharacterized protein n=1 Tax=Paraburkholderia steynii TaxID=1245441 RepID=A0A4R0XRQ5_9BURK|nr:hypothetical protein BZM27_06160 [Paraburkholderia steynii]